MSNQEKPFWETNVNPITMFTTVNTHLASVRKLSDTKGRLYVKEEELSDYVSGYDLRKQYKIGGQKLRDIFATVGTGPRFYQNATYYSNEHLDIVLEALDGHNKVKTIDLNLYISNQELMDMFKFNPHKAWSIANNEKLTKVRFSGNVNYYEREKAIATFSKYVK